MMGNKIQKRIEQAYFACERLSDKYHGEWFRQAREVAEKEEREHRASGKRFTNGQASYKLPIATAAMYFAVRWFLDSEFEPPRSYCDAAKLRGDALLGLAARDRVKDSDLDAWLALYAEFQDVRELDYCQVFAA